ncbi:hypothetical protein EI71_01671 [Anaeroplasma bactoclasticum]|jgi:hypothetical protein|uniref:Uncharacterized protein n=1 Tax=Anaeroplasma bactoclasticum TaxID=2088 RepID=A0A397QVE7_9MOLU|nr:hypothetical protein [Anaeroplasma bactoclasticum]RIA65028.1 hypothetical protein EI71_01671 [Anaeroplasma bactoclasticum]
MGLFDRKIKVKTQTVDFVQKRVEMSSLFSTYIEYLNDTEEHNKGDFEIYHWEQADRKSRPYITVRYDAATKKGEIFFDDQFEFECGEMTVDTKSRSYQLALAEPNVTIHKFGAKKINNKAMIRYISILNSINSTKVKPSLFYDINNLEDAQKPVEYTYCLLSNTAKPGDLFAEALSASGDKYEYYITETGVRAVNKAYKQEEEAKAKAEAEAKAKAETAAAIAKAEAEKAKAEAEALAAQEAKMKAEAEARAKAEAEAKIRAQQEAEARAQAQELAKHEAEARAKAEALAGTEAAKKAAEEARRAKAEAEAAAAAAEAKAAEEARAAAEAKAAAEAERAAAKAEAQRAREEAKKLAEEEAAKARAEAKAAAEAARAEARAKAEEAAAKAKAEEEARKKAEEEAAAAKAAVEAAKAKAENAAEQARKDLAKEQMKQMLRDGMPPKLVAKYTGFAEEEVQKVADVMALLGDL